MNNLLKATLLSSALLGATIVGASAQTIYNGPDPAGTLGTIITAPLAVVGAPFGVGPLYTGRSAYEGQRLDRRSGNPAAFYNETDNSGMHQGAENPQLGN